MSSQACPLGKNYRMYQADMRAGLPSCNNVKHHVCGTGVRWCASWTANCCERVFRNEIVFVLTRISFVNTECSLRCALVSACGNGGVVRRGGETGVSWCVGDRNPGEDKAVRCWLEMRTC